MKQSKPRTNEKPSRRLLHRLWMGFMVVGMLFADAFVMMKERTGEAEAASTESAQRNGRIVMYVPDAASLTLREEAAAQLDQINYAFALLDDGEATDKHLKGIRTMSAYLRRHPHIDGVLSVGGWGADGFSQACATAEGRARLAQSMLTLMDKHGFVGIDVDWEYPGFSMAGIAGDAADVENWYALLTLLRQGLDARQDANGRDYLLSVALGAGEEQLSTVDGERLNTLVDQAVLMGYDLKGFDRQTGHHAGLYPNGNVKQSVAWAVNTLTDSGFGSGKVLLGIPAYARVWREVTGEGDGLHQRAATSGNKTLTYDAAHALQESGYTLHYDEEAQAAYLYGDRTFVSVEDERSITAKVQFLQEHGLLGAAVWSWTQDPSGTMLDTLCHAMEGGV